MGRGQAFAVVHQWHELRVSRLLCAQLRCFVSHPIQVLRCDSLKRWRINWTLNPITLRGAGQRLQGRGSRPCARGAGDACTEPPSVGMRNRVSQAGGAPGCAAVPVLLDRAPADGGVAGRKEAFARTPRQRSARRCTSPRAGAAMTGPWGLLPALAWCASTRRGVLRASGIASGAQIGRGACN